MEVGVLLRIRSKLSSLLARVCLATGTNGVGAQIWYGIMVGT